MTLRAFGGTMKNKKKLTKKEVFEILDDVEKSFGSTLSKSEEARKSFLAKSEEADEEAKKAEEKKKEEEEKKKKEEEEKKEGDELEKCGQISKSEEGYTEEQFTKELDGLYGDMPITELQMHQEALNSAMVKHEQAEGEPMRKSEDFYKNELAARDEKIEKLEKSLESIVGGMNKFLGQGEDKAPEQKAATNLDYIAKSEGQGESSWTKDKIEKHLERISKSAETSAEDRASINEYYLEGRNVQSIEHLLK